MTDSEKGARDAAESAADQARTFERFLTDEATADDYADYGYPDGPEYGNDEIVGESILEGYAVVHDYGDYQNTEYVVIVTGTGGPHTEMHAYPGGDVYGVGQDWGTPKVRQFAGNLPMLSDWCHTVWGVPS